MALQSAVHDLANSIIEDTILDLVFDLHRSHKLAALTCPHCTKSCRSFGRLNVDIHNHDPTAFAAVDRVKCQQCKKSVGSTMFARHLEKCLCLQSARGANRKNLIKSYAEDGSSPEKKRKKISKSKLLPTPTTGGINEATDSSTSTTSLSITSTIAAPVSDSDTSKPKKPAVKRRKKNAVGPDGLPLPKTPSGQTKTKKKKAPAVAAGLPGSSSDTPKASNPAATNLVFPSLDVEGGELFDIDENDLDVIFE